jgi:hypothetical protein
MHTANHYSVCLCVCQFLAFDDVFKKHSSTILQFKRLCQFSTRVYDYKSQSDLLLRTLVTRQNFFHKYKEHTESHAGTCRQRNTMQYLELQCTLSPQQNPANKKQH